MDAYSKKYNYIIRWNAKSGCTFFRQLFLKLHYDEIEKPTNKWHNIHHDFPLPDNLLNIKKIILCRNPYYRAVSMFCNKYCGGKGHSILPEKIKLKKCTFRNFLNELNELKKQKKLNNIDGHISEQSHNVIFNKDSYILKIENLNETICDIYKKMNLETLIPKIKNFMDNSNKIFINKTNRNLTEEYIYDIEYSPESVIFPDYKYFYNQELLDLCYEIYKDDFINFNYEKTFN